MTDREQELTNHWLDDAFSHLDELLVDLDAQVTQNLAVLGQVEVLQTVFVLFGGVLSHEGLMGKEHMTLDRKWGVTYFLTFTWSSNLTSSPLYCFRQCSKRLLLANQNDIISKSSLFLCRTKQNTGDGTIR